MRRRLVGLLVAAIILSHAPSPSWAQQIDVQKIKNLKSQQTNIENRIAELQGQVDDAYAGKTYCSAKDRTEDFNRLRALQREIAALRKEYADFKAGFIKLAATATAGPQFDAAGIHPDERSYWTADDNALQKLRDSALAKANRVEQAPIRDCDEKKTTPTPAPVSQSPSKSSTGDQPGSGKSPPITPQAPPTGPTTPLGGQPGTGCTEKERTERRLRLQEEILRLERELIPIDGTRPQGRARQLELIREIDRLNALMGSACPPLLPPLKPSTGQAGSAPPVKLNGFEQRILDLHNAERAAVGVPPLRWNPALESAATAYAEQLARTGQRVHAPRDGRADVRENLNQGMLGWNTDQMMGNWLVEKRSFIPGIYPNVSRTGDWTSVSHYTQMIWPATTDIGCGMAKGSGYQWLVCRYSPGGNKDGKAVGVPPPKVAAKSYQWIDVKTGKPVTDRPVVTTNGKTYYVQADIGDPNRAYDPESGRNFARENGRWIDVKTGKPVTSRPVITSNGKTYYVQANIGDPNSAYDPETGRNFARQPVPATPKR